MGRTPIPLVPPPTRPSFATWIEWAKWHYVRGVLTFEEFDDYVGRLLASDYADDRWYPLPGGLNPLNRDGRLLVDDRDLTFEHNIELRALRKGVLR